jgi:outer membrane protein OmpA-like peptidoglycan-associated protein
MKQKSVVFLCGMLLCLTASSQSFIGYGYDNYSGVNGVLLNPGVLADSKYKINVNIFAASAYAANNAFEMDQRRLFGLHFNGLKENNGYDKIANTADKYAYFNTDILGPSATINLTKRDAIALITRERTIGNEYNLGNPLFQLTGTANSAFYNTSIINRSLQMKVNSFAEAGVSYGRVLMKNDHAEMKLGITGKYISGVAFGSFSTGPLQLEIDPTNTIINMTGNVTAQYSSNLDNLGGGASVMKALGTSAGHGFGMDIGFVYEVKHRNNPNEEKFRLGLSITDIGQVSYHNSPNGAMYTLNVDGHNTSELQKLGAESMNDYFTRLKTQGLITPNSPPNMATVKLPTAVRFNFDYNIFKRLYINADVLMSMLATSNPVNPNYITSFTVTPRLEKKWVSIYSPVSYNVEGQLNWGAGVRVGPVFVGSGSVVSAMFKKKISSADAHIGLTIPIFQHRKGEDRKDKKQNKADTVYKAGVNDRDGDGVVDAKDECPDSAGPVALLGCPDRDGDGVPDIHDKCPDVPGSKNFHGCPAPDTDGDSVNDDEDKCPLVKGVKSNYGCPPINPLFVSKVRKASDRVFFVRAKATIEAVSFGELDHVAEVLQDDTTLRLRIEGYTDSEGPDAREMKLSERRARSVERYLEMQGIAASRMDVVGYGKTRPIAPNDSPEGMARNRRVEMVLMNYPKDKAGTGGTAPAGGSPAPAGAAPAPAGGAPAPADKQ